MYTYYQVTIYRGIVIVRLCLIYFHLPFQKNLNRVKNKIIHYNNLPCYYVVNPFKLLKGYRKFQMSHRNKGIREEVSRDTLIDSKTPAFYL